MQVPAKVPPQRKQVALDQACCRSVEGGNGTAQVDTTNANEAAELDAIALLADTWDVDLMSDPELSSHFVQANALAYFSFGSGKGKGKGERKAKGKYLVRPSHCITGRPSSTIEGSENENRVPCMLP